METVSYTSMSSPFRRLTATLYGGNWYDETGHGANFYIVDVAGDNIFYSGTRCPSIYPFSTSAISLPNGDYQWRVAGANVPDADSLSWSFCGLTGGVSEQFDFQVVGASCYPKSLWNVSAICSGEMDRDNVTMAEQLVTLRGVVQLKAGVSIPTLAGMRVLEEAIAQEFSDAHVGSGYQFVPSAVRVTGVDTTHTAAASGRTLIQTDATAAVRYTFEARLSPRSLCPSPAHSSSDEAFVASVSQYLSRSFDADLFVTRVRNSAARLGVVGLTEASDASLASLVVVHQSVENKAVSVVANAVVVGSAFACVITGTLLLVSFMRRRRSEGLKYQQVDVSEHRGTA